MWARPNKSLKLDVYGKEVLLVHSKGKWEAFYSGNEGKRRRASDIIIPSNIRESEVVRLISDLCHEWATAEKNEVRVLAK